MRRHGLLNYYEVDRSLTCLHRINLPSDDKGPKSLKSKDFPPSPAPRPPLLTTVSLFLRSPFIPPIYSLPSFSLRHLMQFLVSRSLTLLGATLFLFSQAPTPLSPFASAFRGNNEESPFQQMRSCMTLLLASDVRFAARSDVVLCAKRAKFDRSCFRLFSGGICEFEEFSESFAAR